VSDDARDARHHKQQHTIEALARHCQRLTGRLDAAEQEIRRGRYSLDPSSPCCHAGISEADDTCAACGLVVRWPMAAERAVVGSIDLGMWSDPGWKELGRRSLLRRECVIPYRVRWSGPLVLGALSGTVAILGAIWEWLR